MTSRWRTVRVFISSTFRDMHDERDCLIKVVFPELRERCAKRQLHLVDMDLRWGVTEEEAEQGKVLHIILDEIDRSRPFFVAILGERYGYVPGKVPEDTEFLHPWLRDYADHSLTALEIIHGVLRNPDLASRSFFYLRDPQFISEVPESKRADFMAENPEAARKLATLKDKIRASGRPVMENYPCRWDKTTGQVIDLGSFGEQVLEDLWTAICEEHPEEAPDADPLATERQMHEAFAEERSHLHVGRMEQARRLTEYVQGRDRRPGVITGESGCGKSAFLASWYLKHAAENPDDFVLAYFIGASPDSTNHLRLLRNICQELKRQCNLKEEIPEDDKKLSETLAILLADASQGKSRIVLVIDALDQLSPLEGAHGLGWLLDYIPEKVRLVVSSLEGDYLDVLRRHEAEEITLPPLTTDEQREIVQALLGEWRRKLDDRQMSALLSHPGVKNPLYLGVALEELRLFGRFEQLTLRIEALAEDIPGLFDQVLARLEEDHGRELVTEAFSLLGCSRYGLSETELLDLLSREGEVQLPRALWARLARSARMYIIQRGELFGFFHRQLAEAVATRYPEREKSHGKLATYFQNAPLERKLDEYPYQLQHAEQWQTLANTLSDLDLFEHAWENDRKYEWIGYWRALEGRFEPGPSYQAAIEAREKLEGETLHIARLLSIISQLCTDMTLLQYALILEEHALQVTESILGPNHLDVASSLERLAEIHKALGNYNRTLSAYHRELAIKERILGSKHLDLAPCLLNLAELYFLWGDWPKGTPFFNRADIIYIEAFEFNRSKIVSLDVADHLARWAGINITWSRYKKALPILQRVLAAQEKILGPNHPKVAHSLRAVAMNHEKLGQYADAIPLVRRALEIYRSIFGSENLQTAEAINDLAILYQRCYKTAEALKLAEEALQMKERVLGPGHLDVAESLNQLALAYYNQDAIAKALPLFQRALLIGERARNLYSITGSINGLRWVYERQDNLLMSMSVQRTLIIYMVKDIWSWLKADWETRNWITLAVTGVISLLLSTLFHPAYWGIFALAMLVYVVFGWKPLHPSFIRLSLYTFRYVRVKAKIIKRSIPVLPNKLLAMMPDSNTPKDQLLNASCCERLGTAYTKQGKYNKALPYLQRALEIRGRILGYGHPDVATSLNNLAFFYHRQCKCDEALPLYQQALAILEYDPVSNRSLVTTFLINLASLSEDQGKYTDAEYYYKRALANAEEAPDTDQYRIAKCLNYLASFYKGQGKYAEAVPLYQRAVSIAEATLGPKHSNTKSFKQKLKICQDAMRNNNQ
jgi:nephrocystin-3